MNPIEFITNSSLEAPIICTYRNVTLISDGEGGNRHLFLVDNHLTNAGEHIWVDTHIDGNYFGFISTYPKGGKIESALVSTATNVDNCGCCKFYYFTAEDIERFINALIDIIR